MAHHKQQGAISQAIVKVQNRHLLCYASAWFFKLLTGWNFIVGFLFLILRQLGFALVDFIGFSIAGLPVCILLAILIAYRRRLNEGKILALLDNHNRCGGLLLAERETGDESWMDQVSENLQIPDFRVNFSARLPNVIFSVVFIILCVVVPVYSGAALKEHRINLGEIKDTLVEQIDTLVETETLSPEKAEELSRALEQIVAGSDRNDPSKTFEALDQLQEKLKKEARQEAQKILSDLEKLGQMNSLAEELKKQTDSSSEAAESLKEMLKKFAGSQEGKEFMKQSGEAGKAMEGAMQDGEHSHQAMQEAARQLQDYIDKESEKKELAARKMKNARLIDQQTLEKLLKEGKLKKATLKDIMNNPDAEVFVAPSLDGSCNNGGEPGLAEGQNGQDGQMVGSGGAGRDGGSAPLNFNRLTSDHKVKFIDEALPSPNESSLEDSVVIGQGVTAPELLPADHSQSGSVQWNNQQNSAAESEIILPRHRNAVRNFFDRNNP